MGQIVNKQLVRSYKSHYGARWAEFRYNQKNSSKVLLLENKFVLSNLVSGSVLAVDCLGEVYNGIIEIDTSVQQQLYQNVLAINNIEFKYKTVSELVDLLVQKSLLIDQHGRLIVNFCSAFVLYDRINFSINTLVKILIDRLQEQNFMLVNKLVLKKINTFGFGNVFLSLEKING